MAISAPGVGSGLDVKNIVAQLVELERKPIQQVQTQISSLQSSISAWGQIRSGLSKLQDAAAKLLDTGLWQGATARSSNADALEARTTGSAFAGSYTLETLALAQAQTVRTAGTYATGPLGFTGRLEISRGDWNDPASFSAAGSAITIEASDTLTTVAQKINAAGAGVTALVVNSGGGQVLVLKGTQTGAANGFAVQAFDDNGDPVAAGSSGIGELAFAYDTTSGTASGLAVTAMAQDARLSIDGVEVRSATNRFTGAAPGLEFTIKALTTAPVTVEVATDTASMVNAVKAFQQAFNELTQTIKTLTRADPTGDGNGPLRGDQAAIGLLTMLRNYVGSAVPGQGRLLDLGLSFSREGTLSLKESELNTALADPGRIEGILADTSGGIARRVRDFTQGALAADGSTTRRETSLKDSIKRKEQEIVKLEERVQRTEKRLLAQYAVLDTQMARYSGLSAFVSQQLAAWSNPKGGR